MAHNSPCDLVDNIDSLYPDTCNGSEGCACESARNCGNGDGFGVRLGHFGVTGWRAENIAGSGDPFTRHIRHLNRNCPLLCPGTSIHYQ